MAYVGFLLVVRSEIFQTWLVEVEFSFLGFGW